MFGETRSNGVGYIMVDTYAARDLLLGKMGYDSYRMYLTSRLWAVIRKRCLTTHDHTCVLCGGFTYTVHHYKYTREVLQGRDDSQLYPLCKKCHKKVEMYRDGTKRCLSKAQKRFTELIAARGSAPVKKRHRLCKGCGSELVNDKPFCYSCSREVRRQRS